MISIPPSARIHGFEPEGAVAHTGKTLMLAEVRLLFDAAPLDASLHELRRLVVEENVLRKDSASNRRETLKRLRQLYGLSPDLSLYRALRDLWAAFPEERPLLALLCASGRDPVLRASASYILSASLGDPIAGADFQVEIRDSFPDRYSPKSLRSIGGNLASTWHQSGHLTGTTKRVRSRAKSGPGSTAYALWMGHLCGARGRLLFETLWAKLLDAPTSVLESHAFAASQRGWIEYRSAGEVVEIGFRRLEERTEGGSHG